MNALDIGLEDAVAVIDRLVPNARSGLPDPVFYLSSRLVPMINVDLLIVNEMNQKLLTWRADRFYGPGWHLPGGIIRFKETMSARIDQVALRELGVRVQPDAQPMAIGELINPDRDIRGHFISFVFKCRLLEPLRVSQRAASDEQADADQWRWFDTAPVNIIKQHIRFADVINRTVY